MVVKNVVPFWVLNMIRHLVFRDQKGTIIVTTTQIHKRLGPKGLKPHLRPGSQCDTPYSLFGGRAAQERRLALRRCRDCDLPKARVLDLSDSSWGPELFLAHIKNPKV